MASKSFKFKVPNLEKTLTRFPRGNPDVEYDTSKDFEFQITDWFDRDVATSVYNVEDPDDEESKYGIPDPREYTIDMFGVTKDGHSVSCTLSGYKPYFYIKTNNLTKVQIENFIKSNITHREFKKNVFNRNTNEKEVQYYYVKRSFNSTDENGSKQSYTYESALVDWEVVYQEDLGAGFTGIPAKKFQFVKLVFNNESAMKSCCWMLKREQHKLKISIYEANIPPLLRFMHIADILAAGWVKIDGNEYEVVSDPKLRDTTTQIEIRCRWNKVHHLDKEIIAPIREASFDIECYSQVHSRMPIPEEKGNPCIQIATTIYDYGTKDMQKHIIVLGECGPIDGVTVVECKTEAELLKCWSKFLRETDPDVIHGYNIFGFDLHYLITRAKHQEVGCYAESSFMGRFKWMQSDIVHKQLKSAAYGDNYMKLVPMPGRQHIDVMKVIQRDVVKYPSYKLGFISQEILSNKIKTDMLETTKGSSIIKVHHPGHSFEPGTVVNLLDVEEFGGLDYYDFNKTHLVYEVFDDYYTFDVTNKASESMKGGGELIRVYETKHDLPPKKLFEYFASGEEEKIRTIAEYCVQDTMLPQKIVNKKCILEDLIEMAKVTSVPIGFLIIRGQQIKVFSLLTKYCRTKGILVPTIESRKSDKNKEKFKGATVLTALSGAYFDGIACLDFAALYPSNMIDWNLCYTTLVKDQQYANMEGVKYHTFNLGNKKYTYAQSNEGILPQILNHLLNARSRAKKKMEAEKDPFMKKKYDSEQLAYKVTCNSVYGFTGCGDTGMMPCEAIAETTTSIGRDMIENSQDFAENIDNVLDVISCKNYFPVEFTYLVFLPNGYKLIFTGEQILKYFGCDFEMLKSQKSIHITDKNHPNYLYSKNNNDPPKSLSVWTTDRWQPVSVLYAKRDVDPVEVSKGNHNAKRWLMRVKTEKGEQLSFEKYGCKVVYGDTDSVFTNFDTTHLDDPVQKIAYSMQIGSYVANKITDYLRSLNPYKDPSKMRTELEYEKVYLELFLLTKKRYVGSLYTFDPENMAYFDQKGVALKRRDYCKFVKEVFRNIIKCFFDKYVTDKEKRISNATAVVVQAVDDLLNNRVPFDKLILSKLLKDSYKMREETNTKTKNGCKFNFSNLTVGDIIFWNDYEDGRCVGEILSLNRPKQSQRIFGSEPQSKRAKNAPSKPVSVKCTKVKVQLKSKSGGDDDEVVPKKGRLTYDYDEFQYPSADKMLIDMDFEDIAAKDGYTITLNTILDPDTRESDLEGVKQAHVRLARRMYLRDPGSAPESGTRVPYVFVERANKDALQHEKSEDPEYAKLKNLKIDPEYYLLHQLKTPISQMFALVMKDPEEILFEGPLRQYKLSRTGQRNITSFFNKV